MTTTPDQQAMLDGFNALSDEAKVGVLEKVQQRFGAPVSGEVKWGASMPGEIPPSGEMDPVTGAPVPKQAAEGEPPAPQPQPSPVPPGPPPPYTPPPGSPPPQPQPTPPPTTALRTTTTTVRR